jgi:pimeloyl-ACP methyl ester carboxylesterase
MAQPWLARARAELTASGLSRTDPDKYRRIAFTLSVAGYFRDPSQARLLTPFRITARTQQAVWASLGAYDLRPEVRRLFPNGAAPRALLVHGVYDPMPLESARETASLLGTGVIELATGHAPHVEAPEHFEQALDGFLPTA